MMPINETFTMPTSLVTHNSTSVEGSGDSSVMQPDAPIQYKVFARMECQCQHGTDGPNCDTCLPDHWDRPWKRANQDNPNECKRKIIH